MKYTVPFLALFIAAAVHAEEQRTVEQLIAQLQDPDPMARRAAAEGLAQQSPAGDEAAHTALEKALADTESEVKRAVVLAIGKVNAPGAPEVIAAAYRFDDGTDADLTAAYGRALEACGKKGIDALIGLAQSGNDADRDRAVAAFLAARTRAAAEGLPAMLSDPHLKVGQRITLVESLKNYKLDPPLSPEPLLEFLASHPKQAEDVQGPLLEALTEMGVMRGAKVVNLLTNLLDSENARTREIAVAAIEKANLAEAAPRLVQALGEKSRSSGERVVIIKALGRLKDRDAVKTLKGVFDDTEPSEVRVEALRSLTAIDAATAEPIAAKLLDQPDSALRSEAVKALGERPAGARLLARHCLDKKLEGDALPMVAAALRKHATDDSECAELLKELAKAGLLRE